MDFIILSGIIIPLIIFLFLVNNERIQSSHILLISFYVIILALFLNFYAAFHKIYWLFVLTNIVSSGTGYLLGAIIYFYVCSLAEKLALPKIMYHLLPFLLFVGVVTIPFSLSNPNDGYFFDYLQYIELYSDEMYLAELFVFFVFTLKAHKKIQQYDLLLPQYFSTIDKNSIRWVKKMIGGVFLFILIDLLITIYLIISNDSSLPEIHISILLVAFISFYISYHGMYLSKVFIPKHLIEIPPYLEEKKTANVHPLPYTEIEVAEVKQKLEQLMSQKRLYLNDSLTLSDLAKEMSIPEKKLSAFINRELQTSFYKLINLYRLTEFKAQLGDPLNQKYSLLAIANQSGFKSKTSFYSFFKEQTGMTPSQYHKEISNSSN